MWSGEKCDLHKIRRSFIAVLMAGFGALPRNFGPTGVLVYSNFFRPSSVEYKLMIRFVQHVFLLILILLDFHQLDINQWLSYLLLLFMIYLWGNLSCLFFHCLINRFRSAKARTLIKHVYLDVCHCDHLPLIFLLFLMVMMICMQAFLMTCYSLIFITLSKTEVQVLRFPGDSKK